MQVKPYLTEITLTIVCFMWLLFVATNVSIVLGQTYLHFALGSLALLIIGITIFDKKLSITFQKQPGGHLKAMMMGFAGWIVLIISSVVVMRFVDPTQANIASIIALLGATTPALATSKIANFITFGVAIAFIETTLWARLMEFFADIFKIRLDKRNLMTTGVIVLIGLLSLGFAFFHITAKGITATASLVVVFVMMAISLGMVVIFGETRQAIFLHCFANTVASWLIIFALGI